VGVVNAALKAVVGAVVAGVGVWTLADLPIVNPLPALALGWVLLILGMAILAPAIVDLFGVDR
jgi:sulfite exporter TauE/SafE